METCRRRNRDQNGMHREGNDEVMGLCKTMLGYRKSSCYLDDGVQRKGIGREARLQGAVSLCCID